MNERWLRGYPKKWRARYGEEMAELLSETPLGIAPVVDLIRGSFDAWLRRLFDAGAGSPGLGGGEVHVRRRPSPGLISSLAIAAALVSLGPVLIRAVAAPQLAAVGGASAWSSLLVAGRIVGGGVVVAAGLALAWQRRWRTAAMAIALGTGLSSLGADWEAVGSISPQLAAHAAAGLGGYLPPPPLSVWDMIAFYWPLQFLLGLVAIAGCAASARGGNAAGAGARLRRGSRQGQSGGA